MNYVPDPDDGTTEGPDAAGARGSRTDAPLVAAAGVERHIDQGELSGGLALFASRCYAFSSASRRATLAAARASSTAASASPATLDRSCARTRSASAATSSACA